ncbi:MAG: lytic transglycosylase domain-containing protein [Brevinematia bacterium]
MKLVMILILVFCIVLFSLGMVSRLSVPEINISKEFLDKVLDYYNGMDFANVVLAYFSITNLVTNLEPHFYYVFANSLYKLSNYSEVLKFTNFNVSDEFFSNNIMLLVGFSLSELKEFDLSESIIRSCVSNLYFTYFDELIEYYRFRNALFLNRYYISSSVVTKFLKQEDIDKLVELLPSSSDGFCSFISRLLSSLRRNSRSFEIVRILRSRNYSYSRYFFEIGKAVFNAGFISDGITLILKSSLPDLVKDYYRAYLALENKQYTYAKSLISNIISSYSKNKTLFNNYSISYDDILVLNLRLYSNVSSKDFNATALKYLRVGGIKFLEYVLINYKLLEKEVYLSFITNYFSKSELNYRTKKFVTIFVSFNLAMSNISDVKKFSYFMLNRTKGTSWEKEFLWINFLISDSYSEKSDILKTILVNYPFTYEYLCALDFLKDNETFWLDLRESFYSNYNQILSNYAKAPNIKDLNSIIGLKFMFDEFGFRFDSGLDIFREVNKFKSSILDSLQVTNTNMLTNDGIFKKFGYIDLVFSRGIVLDIHLEIRKVLPIPMLRYLKHYEKYRMTDYVVRSYERFGLYRDNIFDRRAVVVLAFLKELYPTPFLDRVEYYSYLYKVDKSIIYSIMKQESKYSPFVVSFANAMGLMQLIFPTANETARRFWKVTNSISILDIFNLDNNLHLGILHIKELMNYFSNYPRNFQNFLVLASYNAGSTAVKRWLDSFKPKNHYIFAEIIRYHETREYLRLVLENMFIYQNFVFNDLFAMKR